MPLGECEYSEYLMGVGGRGGFVRASERALRLPHRYQIDSE